MGRTERPCIRLLFLPNFIKGINHKSRNSVNYPNLQSAQRPIPHSDNLPVPQRPVNMDDVTEESVSESSDSDPTFEPSTSNKEPHFITQNDLNDLVRDLDLSKRQAELLASRLHDWNLLEKNTRISVYRSRHTHFSNFFSQDGNIVFCSDIPSVMTELKFEYKTSDWRLFIDSSKVSLKAVLLHNGNKYPSVPVAHATEIKESYENMKSLLEHIKYNQYSWKICGDLKVIAILLGLQLGYTKFSCFLCEWDSRDKKNHYVKKEWPKRDALIPGQRNVLHTPLINPEDVLLPPLHIKLGLMKNFVKAMNKNGDGFVT
ncbi:hypothetical protein EVAR_60426_1 [Eumeta japonica]|uniref:Uncharacterized protein n=1 Tax=Eumeta variegata TaxID=151549 RepID=A0A4C1ZQC2_EUMVA|nr:hypothetical protein EVAR_60426_1 [Eumeta japonica]